MKEARCPICDQPLRAGRATDPSHRPFCSERCRRIDLGRWLGEKYRIKGSDDSVIPDAQRDDADV